MFDSEPTQLIHDIARLAAQLLGCEAALITLADGDCIWFTARPDLALEQIAGLGSLSDRVLATRVPLSVADCAQDPRFAPAACAATGPPARFYTGMPLLTERDVCLGVLSVIDTQPRVMATPVELDALCTLARLVLVQLEHRRAQLQLCGVADRALRMKSLHESVAAAPTCERALTELLTALCLRHNAAIGRIWRLMLPSEVMLEVCRYQGTQYGPVSYFDIRPRAPVSVHNSFDARSIRANQPAMLRYNEVNNPEEYALLNAALQSGLDCQISYPIWVQGQHFGISMAFADPAAPLAGIIADIASLEPLVRPVLARKVTEDRLLQLGSALDRAADGVLITEAGPDLSEALIIYANAGFCQLTGYTQSEIIGSSTLILRGPETDRTTTDRIEQAMREWRPIRTELLNYRKDSSPVWVELDIAPMANADGVITHWVSIRRDITQRRFAATEGVNREKLRSLGEFTGGIAHDFNNLLTVISLNVEDAVRRRPDDGDLACELESALQAATRGAELTAQLLSYASRAHLQPQCLCLAELLETLRMMLQRVLGEAYALRIIVEDQGLVVSVNASQFENAVTNLILNARDAMPDGGVITITVNAIDMAPDGQPWQDAREAGRYVQVRVSDSGSGIAAKSLSRVFDPFFTTKEVGHGSGLGLSMVHGFARQSGGAAMIASEPGNGTVATLLLPLVETAAVQVPQARKPELWHAGGREVLVVEDQPEVLRTVEHLMEHLGFTTTSASTADAALAMLRAPGGDQQFDLLFTDIVLPGDINGLDLAREASLLRPDIRILITTGFARQSNNLSELRAAGALLLAKPYKRQDLIDALKQLFPD